MVFGVESAGRVRAAKFCSGPAILEYRARAPRSGDKATYRRLYLTLRTSPSRTAILIRPRSILGLKRHRSLEPLQFLPLRQLAVLV